ncbi:MAG: hypothetical protein SF162_13540 [bacterium]|nr:hypothetical protein [bacterium]
MKTVDPKLEVNGQYLLGIIGSMNEDDVRPYREKHGLNHIDPAQYYSAQKVINFYDDLEHAPGGMFNLVAVGMNIVAHMQYPPHLKTVQDILPLVTQMHYAGWRGAHPGDLLVDNLSDTHVRFTFVGLPLPSDLVYGLCYGLIKRFTPPGSTIRVHRTQADDRISYDLDW